MLEFSPRKYIERKTTDHKKRSWDYLPYLVFLLFYDFFSFIFGAWLISEDQDLLSLFKMVCYAADDASISTNNILRLIQGQFDFSSTGRP